MPIPKKSSEFSAEQLEEFRKKGYKSIHSEKIKHVPQTCLICALRKKSSRSGVVIDYLLNDGRIIHKLRSYSDDKLSDDFYIMDGVKFVKFEIPAGMTPKPRYDQPIETQGMESWSKNY